MTEPPTEDAEATARTIPDQTAASEVARQQYPEGSIDWSEAGQHIGEEAQVCGPLASVRGGEGSAEGVDFFINIGVDYPDPARFVIVPFDTSAIDVLLFTDPGTIVCGTGRLTSFNGVPQLYKVPDGTVTAVGAS